MTKIIAVDFDGTLCEEAWPGIGKEKSAGIEYVKQKQAAGWKAVLWTCRKGRRLEEAVKWCGERGIVFDAVNENLPGIIRAFCGDTRKIYADEYLDDKAVRPPEKPPENARGRAKRR